MWFVQSNRSLWARDRRIDGTVEPCPTIQANGIAGCCRSHYWIEVPVWHVRRSDSAWRTNHGQENRRPVTEPAPAVAADGMWGAAYHQVWLEDDDPLSRTLWSWSRGRYGVGRGPFPLGFAAGPAPTVQTGGIGGRDYWIEEDAMAEDAGPGGKPPYRIPSMAEIAQVPWNDLTAVSTFAGGGGSCLGYRMAGFRVLWANEFEPNAADTYEANNPGTVVDRRDIRAVQAAEILEACGLAEGELDLFDGSPPCQSFSTAGIRHKGWGKVSSHSDGTTQRSDDLFLEYARLLRGLQPRTFVAENVSGLVKGVAKGFFLEVLAALKACGYRVAARLLDAQWLGVPQQRQRIIFVGVREDLGVEPPFPSPLPYRYSIADALPWVVRQGTAPNWGRWVELGCDAESTMVTAALPSPTIRTRKRNDGTGLVDVEVGPDPDGDLADVSRFAREARADEPAPTVMAHNRSWDQIAVEGGPPPRVIHDTSGLANFSSGDVTYRPAPTITVGGLVPNASHYQVVGGPPLEADPETGYRLTLDGHAIADEYDRLKPGESSDRYFNLKRAPVVGPCQSVTASNTNRGVAGVTHPTQRRKFTLLEVRRLCAFPDDYVLLGSYGQRWARLGNSVPPLMARAVAEALRDRVLLPGRPAGG